MTAYLLPLETIKNAERVGNKANNLQYLARHGFSVPTSHVCTWDAHSQYLVDGPVLEAALRAEIRSKLDLTRSYAVRSSADLEDGQTSSFAGQFQSHLDVCGEDALIDAICSIWAASDNDQLQTYLREQAHADQQPRVAVLIQEMIAPQISGVAFSKKPITGMNEIIIEAVLGSGQALVQEGVTPERWINKWGAWLTKPSESEIPQRLIEQIVKQTQQISAIRRCDVDLEWVYDGRQVYWVQL